jgi:hypothetical protein
MCPTAFMLSFKYATVGLQISRGCHFAAWHPASRDDSPGQKGRSAVAIQMANRRAAPLWDVLFINLAATDPAPQLTLHFASAQSLFVGQSLLNGLGLCIAEYNESRQPEGDNPSCEQNDVFDGHDLTFLVRDAVLTSRLQAAF